MKRATPYLIACWALIFLMWAMMPATAASRFAVCTTTCTWDGSSTAMWSASTGGATGASVPGSGDTVTLDAATCAGGTTCAITVNTNFNITSLTLGACTASTTGCVLDFSVNNNSPTVNGNTGINISGTGTRVLKLGSGTFNLTGTVTNTNSANIWTATTTTNLTFTPGTSTLNFTGNSGGQRVMIGGALTYANVTLGANTSGGQFSITGANTFATLTVTGQQNVVFPVTTTNTMTALAVTGAAATPVSFGSASGAGITTISIASGTQNQAWAAFQRVTFTGGATFAASNSLDLGGNTGITITAPNVTGGGGQVFGQ